MNTLNWCTIINLHTFAILKITSRTIKRGASKLRIIIWTLWLSAWAIWIWLLLWIIGCVIIINKLCFLSSPKTSRWIKTAIVFIFNLITVSVLLLLWETVTCVIICWVRVVIYLTQIISKYIFLLPTNCIISNAWAI